MDGRIFTWGDNSSGQLGIGNYDEQPIPGQVLGLPEGVLVKKICLGNDICACILEDGRIFAWGYNLSGHLGNGNNGVQPRPVQVLGLPEGVPVKQLYLAKYSACILADGRVFLGL